MSSDAPATNPGIDLDRPIPFTWLLVSCIIAAHLWMGWRVITETGIDPLQAFIFERPLRFRVGAGGQYAPLVNGGEYWRLLTSVWVHTGGTHLVMNAISVGIMGRLLEPWIGGVRLWAAFCLGGVFGSVLPHFVGVTQSDGASGGGFALLGLAAMMGSQLASSAPEEDRSVLGRGLWVFVGLNLLVSFLPFIDIVAHLGGLIAGLLLGAVWKAYEPRSLAGEAFWGAVTVGVLGATIWGWLQ